jgi:hypothetical protein
MSAHFGLRSLAMLTATTVGALTLGCTAAQADTEEKILLKGSTTASYFWDDGSGRAGDTGMPASGKPMQKGLAASPSWPLLTEGYVVYKGKKAPFFVGDRGPGEPSNRGIMLDLDAKTFAELTGGTFNTGTLGVDGAGGMGHIDVEYVITKWGDGPGKKNHPVPFSTRAYAERDDNPATPPEPESAEEPAEESQGGKAVEAPAPVAKSEDGGTEASTVVGGALMAGVLAVAGGGVVLGGERLRTLLKR